MRPEALDQYNKALKAGQKYYKDAIGTGSYPYLPVLDEIVDESHVAARMELGVINVPLSLVTGTKSAGRTTALATVDVTDQDGALLATGQYSYYCIRQEPEGNSALDKDESV